MALSMKRIAAAPLPSVTGQRAMGQPNESRHPHRRRADKAPREAGPTLAARPHPARDHLVPRTRSSHHNCCESDCELRVQSGTRIIDLLVSLRLRGKIDGAGEIGNESGARLVAHQPGFAHDRVILGRRAWSGAVERRRRRDAGDEQDPAERGEQALMRANTHRFLTYSFHYSNRRAWLIAI